jgi:hypothetical protein
LSGFVLAARRGKEDLWVRNRAGVRAPPPAPAKATDDDEDDNPLFR